MARFPCSITGHRYAEPQNSAYCAALNGIMSPRSKLRLCAAHAQELDAWATERLLLIPDGDLPGQWGQAQLDNCYDCSSSQAKWSLFIDLYTRGEEPKRFAGASCDTHYDAFAERTSLAL